MAWSKEMKSYKVIKLIPLVFTLLIVIIISLNNQKHNTKLKLLIWDTPISTLGTYIAISSVSGFILSYLFINSLASNEKPRLNRVIKYNLEDQNETHSQSETYKKESSFEQTLIERNYRDPSPTMKAKFRVIGNVEKINRNSSNNNASASYDSVPRTENGYKKDYDEENYDDYHIRDEKKNNAVDWENTSFEDW